MNAVWEWMDGSGWMGVVALWLLCMIGIQAAWAWTTREERRREQDAFERDLLALIRRRRGP